MFDAQYLFEDGEVFTPWFVRQADNLIVTAELIDSEGATSKLEVFGYTKSSEDAGEGAAVASPRLTISSVGTGNTKLLPAP